MIRISGTMYATMRHPIVTASVANTMKAMSGDCFRLMFARAVPAYRKMLGATGITMERLDAVLPLVSSLRAGEAVNLEGLMGKVQMLKIGREWRREKGRREGSME